MPRTIGNELTGTIVKVGSKVEDYKLGDKILMPIDGVGYLQSSFY